MVPIVSVLTEFHCLKSNICQTVMQTSCEQDRRVVKINNRSSAMCKNSDNRLNFVPSFLNYSGGGKLPVPATVT